MRVFFWWFFFFIIKKKKRNQKKKKKKARKIKSVRHTASPLCCSLLLPAFYSALARMNPPPISAVDLSLNMWSQWRPLYTVPLFALVVLGLTLGWPGRAKTTGQPPSPGHRAVVFDEMMQFDVAGTRYVSLAAGPVASECFPSGFLATAPPLVTVFRPQIDGSFSAGWMLGWILEQAAIWLNLDDVPQLEFLAGLIIVVGDDQVDQVRTAMSAARFPDPWKTAWWEIVRNGSCGDLLEPGPHVVANGIPNRPYRIHDDVNRAFVMATRPQATPG